MGLSRGRGDAHARWWNLYPWKMTVHYLRYIRAIVIGRVCLLVCSLTSGHWRAVIQAAVAGVHLSTVRWCAMRRLRSTSSLSVVIPPPIHRGTGYCFLSISLFISLFLCQQDCEQTAGPICMKFSGKVWSDQRTTWLHFWSIPRKRAMPQHGGGVHSLFLLVLTFSVTVYSVTEHTCRVSRVLYTRTPDAKSFCL